MEYAFHLQDLNVYYGRKHVLKNINLQIPERAITAIIGPSGCGKSTLIRCLNRMNDLIPDFRMTGRVLFRGQDIYANGLDVASLRRRIGMLFQKPNPFPKSIFENVAYGLRIQGIRDRGRLYEVVERSLRMAGLWEEVKENLHMNALQLSGGQQQRLCLARALAVDPEVLLLDEPTSSLDPIATAHIENLLNELRGKYTIVLVTHNMSQAARVSDYTAFLWLGEVIEFQDTARLFRSPREKLTEDYLTGKIG